MACSIGVKRRNTMPPWRERGGKTALARPAGWSKEHFATLARGPMVLGGAWHVRQHRAQGNPHDVRSKLEVDHDRHVVAEAGAAPILIVADGQLADLRK